MGMTGNFIQISTDDLEARKERPESLESYLFPDGVFPDCCAVDKAWHGIHFLLAGDPWEGEGAEAQAVLGGTVIGDDLGYGPARYLTAGEVKEVAEALRPVNRDELTRRFDPQAMVDADIYSFHLEDAEDDLEYFATYYEELKRYYEDAAKNGQAMLLFLA